MIEARMSPHELVAWRQMSGLPREVFAARLRITPEALDEMETGREIIPARLDDDVESLVDDVLYQIEDPAPGY